MYREKAILCQEIRNWMKKNHKNQEDLAKILEISQPHVSKIIKESYKSYDGSFKKLCKYASIEYEQHEYDPLQDDELKKTIRMFVGNSQLKAGLVTRLVKTLGDEPWALR